MTLDPAFIKMLQDEFLVELKGLSESFSMALLELTSPATREDGIKKVFRIAHTVKSSSRAAGFENIGTIAHRLEDCLAVVRVHPERLDQKFFDVLSLSMNSINTSANDTSFQIQGILSTLDTEFTRLEKTPIDESSTTFKLNSAESVGPSGSNESSDKNRIGNFELLFEKAKKVALDTANEVKKEVDFFCFGAQVSAPEELIRQISDPCLHLIRNAIDHGAQSKETRLAEWKPEKNRIMLKIALQDEHLVVSVADDGAGIDRARVIEKAISSRLLDGNFDHSKMTNEEVFHFLCEPGFSTAVKVTTVSGRGVGMDIVKSATESMKGTLTISSYLKKGTTFSMKIPIKK